MRLGWFPASTWIGTRGGTTTGPAAATTHFVTPKRARRTTPRIASPSRTSTRRTPPRTRRPLRWHRRATTWPVRRQNEPDDNTAPGRQQHPHPRHGTTRLSALV